MGNLTADQKSELKEAFYDTQDLNGDTLTGTLDSIVSGVYYRHEEKEYLYQTFVPLVMRENNLLQSRQFQHQTDEELLGVIERVLQINPTDSVEARCEKVLVFIEACFYLR